MLRAAGHRSGNVRARDFVTGRPALARRPRGYGVPRPRGGRHGACGSQLRLRRRSRYGQRRGALAAAGASGRQPRQPHRERGSRVPARLVPERGRHASAAAVRRGRRAGQTRWRSTLAPGTDLQWAAPTVTDQLVIVADTPSYQGSAPTARLHALKRYTGEVAWRFDFDNPRQGFGYEQPMVHLRTVFTVSGNTLYAVDLDTGELRWRREAEQPPQLLGAVEALSVSSSTGSRKPSTSSTASPRIWASDDEEGAERRLTELFVRAALFVPRPRRHSPESMPGRS